jgi:hypothetical protein
MKVSFLVWDVPLRYLVGSSPLLFSKLLEALQNSLSSGSTEEKQAVLQWITHLLFDHKWKQALLGLSLAEDLYTNTMEFCLLTPTSDTKDLGILLLKHGGQEFKQDWTELFTMSMAEEAMKAPHNSKEDTTKKDAMDIDSDGQGVDQPQEGGWKLLQGVWTPKPIGI